MWEFRERNVLGRVNKKSFGKKLGLEFGFEKRQDLKRSNEEISRWGSNTSRDTEACVLRVIIPGALLHRLQCKLPQRNIKIMQKNLVLM